MALMNINIEAVPIDLIANLTLTSNSCITLIEFDIITTEGADLTINLTRVFRSGGGFLGHDSAEINNNGVVTDLPDGDSNHILSTGTAKVTMITGNVEAEHDDIKRCNYTDTTITDNTNNLSETKRLGRCVEAPRC